MKTAGGVVQASVRSDELLPLVTKLADALLEIVDAHLEAFDFLLVLCPQLFETFFVLRPNVVGIMARFAHMSEELTPRVALFLRLAFQRFENITGERVLYLTN